MAEEIGDDPVTLGSVTSGATTLGSATEGSVDDPAHFCGPCKQWEEKPLVAFCTECDDFICRDCKRAHERIAVLRKHQIHKGKDMPTAQRLSRSQCTCNSGMQVSSYCSKDDRLLCLDCREKKHKKCPVVSLEDISTGILDTNIIHEAHKNLENLKTAFLAIKSAKQKDWIHLQQTESGILKELAEIKENIMSVFDKLQLSVAQELVLKVNPEDVAIGSEINVCSNIVNDINGRIRRINDALRSRNDVQIFSTVVTEMQENMKYRDFLKQLNLGMESFTLKLDIKKQVQNFLQLTSLGELKVTKGRTTIDIPAVKVIKYTDYVKKT